MADLNFSPKPFVRRDPVQTMVVLAHVLLLVAFLGSVYYLYTLHVEQREQLNVVDQLKDRRQSLQDDFERVSFDLQDLDLRTYDREIRFYAQIQQELQIPWVTLMDVLADQLPDGVRIQFFSSGGSISSSGGEAAMQILAEARSKKDQLTFLEALRNHEAFHNILLLSETYEGPTLLFETAFTFEPATGGGR